MRKRIFSNESMIPFVEFLFLYSFLVMLYGSLYLICLYVLFLMRPGIALWGHYDISLGHLSNNFYVVC